MCLKSNTDEEKSEVQMIDFLIPYNFWLEKSFGIDFLVIFFRVY